MTTLVYLSDEKNVAAQLVDAVAATISGPGADGFHSSATAFVEQKDYASLVTAVVEQSDALFSASSASSAKAKDQSSDSQNDAVACFNVLSTMLVQHVDLSALPGAISALIKSVAVASKGDVLLRLRVLTLVYNHMQTKSPALQCSIFEAILKLASESGHLDLLDYFVRQPEVLVKQWGVGVAEERRFYKLLSEVLEQHDAAVSQKYLIAFLRTLEGTSGEDLAAAKEDAARAVVNCVKSVGEVTEDSVLYQLSAVQQLKSDAKYGKLFELLRIFVDDMFSAYATFYA